MRSALPVLLLALLVTVAVAQEKPPLEPKVPAWTREADALVEKGEFDKAAKLYIKAARAAPKSADPIVGLARLELRRAVKKQDRSGVSRALRLLREAGSREPKHGGIAFVRGEIALATRDHGAAVQAFRLAIRRGYRVKESQGLLARSLVYAGADQAREGLIPHEQVIAVFTDARNRLELLKADETRPKEEREGYDRLWRMTLNNMAAVHQRARDLPKAQSIVEELVVADPENHVYRYRLGLILGDQRRYDEAMEQYRASLTLAKDPDWVEPLRPMAHIASQSERVKEADGYFERFLAKRPDDWDGWLNYGDHLVRHDRIDDAIEAYIRCVEIDRKRFAAVRKLSAAVLRTGDEVAAAKWRALYRILEREREEWERKQRPR